jgi:excinuclease ABC subunit C
MNKPQDIKTDQNWPYLVKKEMLFKIPNKTGVYKFLGKKNEILYIGKATNLKSRVGSYFSKDLAIKRSPLISKMVSEAKSIKYELTETVLESLILEAHLIKKFTPPYNTADKDQKSFYFVAVTKEIFPRILLVREREIKTGKLKFEVDEYFGPYPHGSELKEALKIIRKIFPFRDKCHPYTELKNNTKIKPCFNFQIGLCPGICVGLINQKEYSETIKNIKKILKGNKKDLIRDLEKEMKLLANKKEFEKASIIKKKIFALNHINDISLIRANKEVSINNFRIEAYDISHLSGTNMVGVMTVIENGEINKKEYKMFKIKEQSGADDTKALNEVLQRRFNHNEWNTPNLIVVDGGVAQLNTARKVLRKSEKNIPIVAVTKDERHKPKKILGIENLKDLKIEKLKNQIFLANSEAHRFAIKYHRRIRGL